MDIVKMQELAASIYSNAREVYDNGFFHTAKYLQEQAALTFAMMGDEPCAN